MTQEKKENSFLFNFLIAIFSLIVATLFIVGLFNIIESAFTSYTATTKDVLYFLSGLTSIGFITCIYAVVQTREGLIKVAESNEVITETLIKLLQLNKKDTEKDLKNALGNRNIKTSFRIIDMEDLKNAPYNVLKNLDNILNDLPGKKLMTEEQIKTSTLDELNEALEKAIEKENFSLAASIRDEIKLREEKN